MAHDYTVLAQSVDMQLTRDQVIMALVSEHGLSLNAAQKAYPRMREALGMESANRVSKLPQALELLRDRWDLGMGDSILAKDMIELLMAELNVAEGTARDYIRADSEERGYTVQRQVQGGDEVMNYIAEHAPVAGGDAEWDEFDAAFIEHFCGGDEPKRSRNNLNEYRKGLRIHRMLCNR